MNHEANASKKSIVFFDGVCSLCNAFVDFLIARDKHDRLQFASLQSETAKKELDVQFTAKLSTIVMLEEEKIHLESDAALHAIASLGGAWKIVLVLKVLPRFIRNAFYQFVARNRYKWFGKQECRIPTAEEQSKILS